MKDKKLSDITVRDVGRAVGWYLITAIVLGIMIALITYYSC